MLLQLFVSSLLFFALSLISDATATRGYAFTNDTDKQALLAFKSLVQEDTNGSFVVLNSWIDSVHFCNWKGVSCSLRHQRVTSLDLHSLNLVGLLSPRIANLTFLKLIDLSDNNFHGVLPQEIGRLFRLRHLALGNNSFQGNIPTNLSQCLNLETLILSHNNLQGNIPQDLKFLLKLSELYLDNNHFAGKIPPLANLSILVHLSFRSNNLEGYIPDGIGCLTNLRFLSLADNKLSGMVPNAIYNLTMIQILSITLNSLSGQLPRDLGISLPNLQEMYFGDNLFSGPLPWSIINASGLKILDIAANFFTGPVPKNLGILSRLEKLVAYKNRLGVNSDSQMRFLTSLVNCTQLKVLTFSYNKLKGILPRSIANLSATLSYLMLDGNMIYGSLPQGISKLVNLQLLELNENNLNGGIPDSIGKLTKLEAVYLYNNIISGKIPCSFGNVTRLIILSLYGNMLEGSIPDSLGNCTKLEGLDLSLNKLSGILPESVANLSSLTIGLLLFSNKLSGKLPIQVGNMKNVVTLAFSDNRFSGDIPSTLGDCPLLETLHMNYNYFQGPIPSSFQRLRGIYSLDLSSNNLSGKIPNFLSQMPRLSYLNLSFNNFEGEIPRVGVFSNVSAFSIYGNKKVCGGITELHLPPCPVKKVIKKQRKRLSHRVIAAIPTVTVFIVLLLACLFAVYLRRRRSTEKASPPSLPLSHFPKVSYAQLNEATGEFSSENFIGEGRYGSVYKGVFEIEEQVIAIKVLKLHQPGANRSFIAECEALRRIRHRNLVKIITSCSSIDHKGNEFKALVFEFMPNGNLETWLHSISDDDELQQARNLNFIQRLNIAIDVAAALDYLHHHCKTQVVHCDLKPSNVLLDNDLTAHVGDFGLAKLLSGDTDNSVDTTSSSIGVRGTIGYVAPEYGLGEEASMKGDIYSYGILLLEMFTGKRPTHEMFNNDRGLHSFVKMHLPDKVVQIKDPKLLLLQEDDGPRFLRNRANVSRIQHQDCLASILQIGVICSLNSPEERMDMADVLTQLHAIRNSLVSGRERV
ncbi:hypothetical protein K2173_009511 [Erythroxylum novogranatense]|uniref:non-specific serine/threonine protein kinase n=1 Tax=Erythroxylum novogranatense TaxID=1862640 RepID=A0AAV8U6W2_9ROSI|nr:hypothetical protein K2173_009511 [Erythroxylum novogranatense]